MVGITSAFSFWAAHRGIYTFGTFLFVRCKHGRSFLNKLLLMRGAACPPSGAL